MKLLNLGSIDIVKSRSINWRDIETYSLGNIYFNTLSSTGSNGSALALQSWPAKVHSLVETNTFSVNCMNYGTGRN